VPDRQIVALLPASDRQTANRVRRGLHPLAGQPLAEQCLPALTRRRHVPAPRERWETLLSERLARQGMQASPDTIRCLPIGRWQQRHDLPVWHEAVQVRARVTVQDAQQAVQAWLGGLSRLRAYGMGLLTLQR